MNYQFIQDQLLKNKVNISILKESNVYKYLIKNYTNNIYFVNINSMCLKTNPYAVRIRNDKFLNDAVLKNKVALVCGFVRNKSLVTLVFLSESFYNYLSKTNSSNSFIWFPYKYLEGDFAFFDNDCIMFKKSKTKGIKYAFYSSFDNNFNSLKFQYFINNIKNFTTDDFFIKQKSKLEPQIPLLIKQKIKERYSSCCAISYLKNKCPCGNDINIKFLDENDLTYTHLHHIVPRKYFWDVYYKEENSIINWSAVHNEFNLIPLCIVCHQMIHKTNNQKLVSDVFNNIQKLYIVKNIKDDFEEYLKQNTIFKNINDIKKWFLENTKEVKLYE